MEKVVLEGKKYFGRFQAESKDESYMFRGDTHDRHSYWWEGQCAIKELDTDDEQKCLFTSKRDGNYEIYVMRSDGTSQTRLTDNPGIDAFPSWSSDGTKIIYESNHDIWVMNSNGSDKKYLTEGSYPTGSSR